MGPTVNPEAMKSRTKQLAQIVIHLCRTLSHSAEARIISRQLLRSATSVAANYRAVCRSRSTADFTSKLGLVLWNFSLLPALCAENELTYPSMRRIS